MAIKFEDIAIHVDQFWGSLLEELIDCEVTARIAPKDWTSSDTDAIASPAFKAWCYFKQESDRIVRERMRDRETEINW